MWSRIVIDGSMAAAESAVSISAPVRSPAGVEDPGVAVGSLPAQRHFAIERVEGHPVGHEVADAGRRFVAEHPRGLFVDEPGTGGDRVGEVLFGRVERPDCGGDAALRPARVAVVDAALGQDEDGPEVARLEGDEQPRDAAANDDQRVVRLNRAGRGLGIRVSVGSTLSTSPHGASSRRCALHYRCRPRRHPHLPRSSALGNPPYSPRRRPGPSRKGPARSDHR